MAKRQKNVLFMAKRQQNVLFMAQSTKECGRRVARKTLLATTQTSGAAGTLGVRQMRGRRGKGGSSSSSAPLENAAHDGLDRGGRGGICCSDGVGGPGPSANAPWPIRSFLIDRRPRHLPGSAASSNQVTRARAQWRQSALPGRPRRCGCVRIRSPMGLA